MDLKLELRNYLDHSGRLKLYPSRKKYKLLALMYLASRFENGVHYTEKQVNEILDEAHTFQDRCLLRRELFDRHFLGRTRDGSNYWLEEKQPELADFSLD